MGKHMNVHLIAALTPKGVIGDKGTLPWHISEDLKHFKALTSNSCVIIGRKTFDSLNMLEGLPNRKNVVITSKAHKMPKDGKVMWVDSLNKAVSLAYLFEENYKDVFIIGGASIYEQVFEHNLPNILDLSFVKKEYTGDTTFPIFNKQEWEEDDMHDYDEFMYIKYVRK